MRVILNIEAARGATVNALTYIALSRPGLPVIRLDVMTGEPAGGAMPSGWELISYDNDVVGPVRLFRWLIAVDHSLLAGLKIEDGATSFDHKVNIAYVSIMFQVDDGTDKWLTRLQHIFHSDNDLTAFVPQRLLPEDQVYNLVTAVEAAEGNRFMFSGYAISVKDCEWDVAQLDDGQGTLGFPTVMPALPTFVEPTLNTSKFFYPTKTRPSVVSTAAVTAVPVAVIPTAPVEPPVISGTDAATNVQLRALEDRLIALGTNVQAIATVIGSLPSRTEVLSQLAATRQDVGIVNGSVAGVGEAVQSVGRTIPTRATRVVENLAVSLTAGLLNKRK